MGRRPGERWSRFATRVGNAFGLVLLLLIGTYVLESLVSFKGWGGVAINAAAGTTATVALVTADARPRLLRSAAGLAALGVVLAVVSALTGGSVAAGIGGVIEAVLLALAAAVVLGTVLRASDVGFRTILGAISVYVILGLLFSFVYTTVQRFQGGLFFGVPTQTGDFVFFSITTLTTTGYGDLVPAAQPGKLLSGLEMLMGQIFLVTLIAGLVSLWRPGTWARRREDRAA